MATPQCRRSARIASASKQRSTESPAPRQLTSDVESVRPKPSRPHARDDTMMPTPTAKPKTPSTVTPIELPIAEMHPSWAHKTTAPPSTGLRHGFIDIDYTTTPAQSLIRNTPSKSAVPSSEFTFRLARFGADHKLGADAQRMMDELSEEAARIKAEMAAKRERKESSDRRKIATAKGKSSRFSAAHRAEFEKMDSIEGHASSFRAAPGRFTPVKATTPVKAGIKRTQSKANLNEASNDYSARALAIPKAPLFPESKRIRQRIEDDVSTFRPVSRDGTSIPRPKSSGNDSLRAGIPRSQTHGSLMTPTKSSLARTNSVKAPTVSKLDLQRVSSFSAKVERTLRYPSKNGFGGFKSFGTTNNLSSASDVPTNVQKPGRFDRMKSILKGHPSGTKLKSAIPQLSASPTKTLNQPAAAEKMLPPVLLTTPGRKQDRRVAFSPDTKRAAVGQESPSPIKSGIPRSATLSKLFPPKFTAGGTGASKKVSHELTKGEVTYPDLSAYEDDEDKPQPPPESLPGTFTFRSDHTICFENSPSKGFGPAAGQASLRQVRQSGTASPIRMPGSFPPTSELSPNKENNDPIGVSGIAHGMPNKKRHRAGADDEEDDEGTRRGMKKLRKDPPPTEGHALVAPRLTSQASPTKKLVRPASQTPSPQKKKTGGLSLSRLNMLARPKVRN
ncbi:hypothetical protein HD806DRAFT_473443 [Xylariaceae sp. AK1471]|nr:hypothetical protein HD806DRAFT_473443 [Xylariaceae sp. AK1471]